MLASSAISLLPEFETKIGPFSVSAIELRNYRLAPLPVAGDFGKTPLISGFTRFTRLPSEATILGWQEKWPDANVAIITELSGVTIVDIDDRSLLDKMLQRFGDTPLITTTPSGGAHLWYRGGGESSIIRLDGMQVDIKAKGGIVVVPPSIRRSGPQAGKEYGFLQGGWSDLARLQKIIPGSLDKPHFVTGDRTAIQLGQRNNRLFRHLLSQARHCDGEDDLLDIANTWNFEDAVEPIPEPEVRRIVASAWKYNTENRNWVGGAGVCQISSELMEGLMNFSPKHGGDALALYLKLKKEHAARDKRGEPFPVCPEAMARDCVFPWSKYQFTEALRVLRKYPLLELVKPGGKGKGDAHLYRFCSLKNPTIRNTIHK